MFRYFIACAFSFSAALLAHGQEIQGKKNVSPGDRKPGQEVEYEIKNGVKMKFCWIPPGKAQLGSPKAEQDYLKKTYFDGEPWALLDGESESKRGVYESKGFWLAKYPVTQEEYEAIAGSNPSHFSSGGEGKDKVAGKDTNRFPVESVTWVEARAYIAKLNDHAGSLTLEKIFGGKGRFALPHEDQWEYAARGGLGNQRPFYFGDTLNGDKANCSGYFPWGTDKKGDDLGRTSKVGSYESQAPHPWGLCDMSGNVYQWCDNSDPAQKKFRILRGGSYDYGPIYCRSANRGMNVPDHRSSIYGFRLCLILD